MKTARIAAVLLIIGLAACGPRGQLVVHPPAAEVGAVIPIHVASARSPDGGTNAFAADRASGPSFSRFEVSVPPDRRPGTVTFPRALPPDPRTDFLTVSARGLGGESGLVAALNAELAPLPRAEREVFVFTHGFNTNFSEGLYRQAQMAQDFGTGGASVHFSWPSAAAVAAYAYDRESAIFARDALAATLRAVARSNAERIVVAAHSMGALVMMEALRSLALEDARAVFARLQAIVLMNPDLDIDVFRGQVAALDRFDTPVYVFFNSQDRALRASAILRGGGERLGSVRDLATVQALEVTLIDTGAFNDGDDALGHFAVATSPTMIALIRGMDRIGAAVFEDAANRPNPVEATLNVVQGVGEAVLTPLAQ